ncbi:MAG: hypothetical protein M1834_002074 [Cirrosporium novae-zelandiae]|nr:MAG: hypothetical protein M1834_002074 [Cirrosporium novae-zelandiae]
MLSKLYLEPGATRVERRSGSLSEADKKKKEEVELASKLYLHLAAAAKSLEHKNDGSDKPISTVPKLLLKPHRSMLKTVLNTLPTKYKHWAFDLKTQGLDIDLAIITAGLACHRRDIEILIVEARDIERGGEKPLDLRDNTINTPVGSSDDSDSDVGLGASLRKTKDDELNLEVEEMKLRLEDTLQYSAKICEGMDNLSEALLRRLGEGGVCNLKKLQGSTTRIIEEMVELLNSSNPRASLGREMERLRRELKESVAASEKLYYGDDVVESTTRAEELSKSLGDR